MFMQLIAFFSILFLQIFLVEKQIICSDIIKEEKAWRTWILSLKNIRRLEEKRKKSQQNKIQNLKLH